MKKLHLFVYVGAATLFASCAPVQPTAVRGTAGPQPARLYPAEGFLKVYSATEPHNDGDISYYSHTGYSIYTKDGRLVKNVRNAIVQTDEIPETVTLPSRAYTVVAESETAGIVSVPVVIRTGHTTFLHLERNKDWKAPALACGSDLIRLPNGQAIGLRNAGP